MNMLGAQLMDGQVHLEESHIVLSGMPLPAASNPHIIAGIRPEHVHLADAQAANAELAITAIETLGADMLLHGHLRKPGTSEAPMNGHSNNGTFVVRVPGSSRMGGVVPLSLDPNNIHFFDAHSSKRVG